LQKALQTVGVKADLLLVSDKLPDMNEYKDHLIIPVSSWRDYDWLIAPLLAKGFKTLPWLVSDHEVHADAVAKLNQLPWFLTTSEYCKTIFKREGVKPEKIRVLYETVDEDEWQPLSATRLKNIVNYISEDNATTAALPPSFNIRRAIQEGVPILYTLGGDATSKGALEIIAALKKLDPNIPWLWVIKTLPYEFSLARSAREFAKAGRLIPRIKYLTGEFSQKFLLEMMNLCDVYVAVSRSEGFGLPLVEAQMCGKMVITHRSTSTKELVVENETGLTAAFHTTRAGEPRADIDSLARQLHRALTNRALREQLSTQARPIAISRFGKKAIGEQCARYAEEFWTI
jgi:glycosyltransferase involved in cell wall biosynthesis